MKTSNDPQVAALPMNSTILSRPIRRLGALAKKSLLLEHEVIEIIQWRGDAFYYSSQWGAMIDDAHASVQRFQRDIEIGLVAIPCSHHELKEWADRVGLQLHPEYLAARLPITAKHSVPRHKTKQSQHDRDECREVAKVIWQHEPFLSKAEVLKRDQLKKFRNSYRNDTILTWLTKVFPNRGRRGRPPSRTHLISK